MKKYILISIFVIPFVLSFFLMAEILFATENTSEPDKYLSVRDSLLPMFNPDFRLSNKYFPINRINPDVRPYVLFYLEKDDSNYAYVPGGLWLLGIVGTKDDINFVDNLRGHKS